MQPGDEVYLIHSGEYGWILERYDEDTWLIDLDGDAIPVHEEDLVPAHRAESVCAQMDAQKEASASGGIQVEGKAAELPAAQPPQPSAAKQTEPPATQPPEPPPPDSPQDPNEVSRSKKLKRWKNRLDLPPQWQKSTEIINKKIRDSNPFFSDDKASAPEPEDVFRPADEVWQASSIAIQPFFPGAEPPVPPGGPAASELFREGQRAVQAAAGYPEGLYQVMLGSAAAGFSRWLVNRSPESVAVAFPGQPAQDTGALAPGHALHLQGPPFTLSLLQDQAPCPVVFRWNQDRARPASTLEKDLRIRPAAFMNRLNEAASGSEAAAASGPAAGSPSSSPSELALVFPVLAGRPSPLADFRHYSVSLPDNLKLRESRTAYQAGQSPGAIAEAGEDFDLHADKLIDNPEGMDPAAILAIQLARAGDYLDRAWSQGRRSVYLIHGVGSGRLRAEVHNLLRAHPRVRSFHHGHFARYGFGATQVDLDG